MFLECKFWLNMAVKFLRSILVELCIWVRWM